MWIPNNILAQVDEVADIYYVDGKQCFAWNERRHKDEIRLLTGWYWKAKDGSDERQGFKTISVCYRDAFYSLVRKQKAPVEQRRRLKLVKAA